MWLTLPPRLLVISQSPLPCSDIIILNRFGEAPIPNQVEEFKRVCSHFFDQHPGEIVGEFDTAVMVKLWGCRPQAYIVLMVTTALDFSLYLT